LRFLVLISVIALPAAACALEPRPVPEFDPSRGAPLAICGAPSHCPGEDTECVVRTCENGYCGVALLDGPLETQMEGDCRTRYCEAGELVVLLDYDPLDDENDCTSDECVDGEAINRPLPSTYACGFGEATHCDGKGGCIGCGGDDECPPDTACANWYCDEGMCTFDAAPGGTPCGDLEACVDGMVTLPDQCDGAGACEDGGVTTCAPYACAENGVDCRTQCLVDEECCCGATCLVPGLQGFGECVSR
jgi:hypothetical protein